MTDTKPQIWKAQRTPSKINTKQNKIKHRNPTPNFRKLKTEKILKIEKADR